MKKESGFLQIIVIVILFVVIAATLGKNPIALWEGIRPGLENLLDLFVKAIDFLIRSVTKIWNN